MSNKMNTTEFDMNVVQDLPDSTSIVLDEHRTLRVFPLLPNWMVLNRFQNKLLADLYQLTIAELFEKYANNQENGEFDSDFEHTLESLLSGLLTREILNLKTPASSSVQKNVALRIQLTNSCQLRCKHCCYSSGKQFANELIACDWEKAIRQYFDNYGGDRLTITGGEPLLAKSISSVMEVCSDYRDNKSIRLLTNGLLLDKVPLATVNSAFSHIQVSLDGPNSEIHDYVRGEGNFDKTMHNLSLLRGFDGQLSVSMCILPETKKPFSREFSHFYNELKDILPNVQIVIGTGVLSGRETNATSFSESYSTTLEFVKETSNRHSFDPRQEFFPKRFFRNERKYDCGYGQALTIMSNGKVYPCGIEGDDAFGQFPDDSIVALIGKVSSKRLLGSVDNSKQCNSCYLRYLCGGKCRIDNIVANNDIKITTCTMEDRAVIHELLVEADEPYCSDRENS